MQKNLLFLFLLSISCNPRDTNRHSKIEKDSISQIESLKFKNREKYIATFNHSPAFESTHSDENGKEIKVFGKYFCQLDSPLVVPEKYISVKLGEDFSTYNFIEEIFVTEDKDTILKRDITKHMFMSKLSPELKKYATLLEPEFEGYNSVEKSFDFIVPIYIPLSQNGSSFRLRLFKNGQILVSEAE